MKKILTVFLLFFSFANFAALRADVAADLKQAIDRFDAKKVKEMVDKEGEEKIKKIIIDNHLFHYALKKYSDIDTEDLEKKHKETIKLLSQLGFGASVYELDQDGESIFGLAIECKVRPLVIRIQKEVMNEIKNRDLEKSKFFNLKREYFHRKTSDRKRRFLAAIIYLLKMLKDRGEVISFLDAIEDVWKTVSVDATGKDKSKKLTKKEKPLHFTRSLSALDLLNKKTSIIYAFSDHNLLERVIDLGVEVNSVFHISEEVEDSLATFYELIDAGHLQVNDDEKNLAQQSFEKGKKIKLSYNASPLFVAFRNNFDSKIIEKMLDNGADVDFITEFAFKFDSGVIGGKDTVTFKVSLLFEAIRWAKKENFGNRKKIIERMIACGAYLLKSEYKTKEYKLLEVGIKNALDNPIDLLLSDKYRYLITTPGDAGGTQLLRTFIKYAETENAQKLLTKLSSEEKEALINKFDYTGKGPLMHALHGLDGLGGKLFDKKRVNEMNANTQELVKYGDAQEIKAQNSQEFYDNSRTKLLLENGAVANAPLEVLGGKYVNVGVLKEIDPIYFIALLHADFKNTLKWKRFFLLKKILEYKGEIPLYLKEDGSIGSIMTYVEESESFKDSGLKDVLKLHVPQSQRTVAPGPQPEQSQEAQSLNEKTGVLVKAMEKFKDSLDQLAKTLGMARQGLQQAQ